MRLLLVILFAKKTCARSIDFESRITAQHCFIVAQWGAGLESGESAESARQSRVEAAQTLADAQTAALGIIQQSPGSPALSLVGLPLSFDGARPPFAKRAPQLGEDNSEIIDRGV